MLEVTDGDPEVANTGSGAAVFGTAVEAAGKVLCSIYGADMPVAAIRVGQ